MSPARAETRLLVINARTDAHFVGALDGATIASLGKKVGAPVNMIAGPSTLLLAALEEIGVSRVNLGPRPMRAALTLIKKMARELLDRRTYHLMTSDTTSYSEVDRMLEPESPT